MEFPTTIARDVRQCLPYGEVVRVQFAGRRTEQSQCTEHETGGRMGTACTDTTPAASAASTNSGHRPTASRRSATLTCEPVA